MSFLIKKKGVFYLQIRRGGRLMLVSTGATRERDAQAKAQEITAMFDRERRSRALAGKLCEYALALARKEITENALVSPLAALEAQAQTEALEVISRLFPSALVSAGEAWERYLATSPKLKPSALETKRSRFWRFSEWAKGMDMRSLDAVAARAFLGSMKISDQTWNNYCFDIGSVLSGAGLPNPFKGISKSGVTHGEREPMDYETAKRILVYCDANKDDVIRGEALGDFAKFMRILYYTGLRPGDIATLSADEYNDGKIDLKPNKTSRTRKRISVVLASQPREILDSLTPSPDGFFFPHLAPISTGENRSGLSYIFSMITKRMGMEKGGPTLYGFRHLYVTWQLQGGGEKEDVAAAVGHSDTKTTDEFYYHGRKDVSLLPMPDI